VQCLIWFDTIYVQQQKRQEAEGVKRQLALREEEHRRQTLRGQTMPDKVCCLSAQCCYI